jgi:hypothetical protein
MYFLWGADWIYICYLEEIQSLKSSDSADNFELPKKKRNERAITYTR